MSNSKTSGISIVGRAEGFDSSFTHPLLCPPVLQNIFTHLDLEDLKMCRLVCNRWDAITLLQLKSIFMKPVVRICLTDERRLQEFQGFTRLCGFQHFKFTYSMESEAILTQFMNQFKNQIKDVTIAIGIGKNDADINSNLADKFLSFLAQNSSNWKSFGIEIIGKKDIYGLGEIITDAPSAPFESYEVNWSKLISLSIKNASFPIFSSILEKSTKLERLVVVRGPAFSTYQSGLANLTDSLIEFTMVSGWYEPFRMNVIGRLTKLKRLKIVGSSSSRQMTIPPLPELCELFLDLDPAFVYPHFDRLTVFPKLVKMTLGSSIPQYESKEFPIMFPNLKSFFAKYTNGFDGCEMWTDWKNLEKIQELWINCALTDEEILGFKPTVSPQKIHDLKNGLIDWSMIFESKSNLSKEHGTHNGDDTGIQILTELRSITINVKRISNFSIIFGLLKCKALRSVQLLSPSPYLTKDILKWMADELNLMNLSIAVSSFHSDWMSSDEAKYFRMKQPLCQLNFSYTPYEI